jgi:4-hydroxyproline epimerase
VLELWLAAPRGGGSLKRIEIIDSHTEGEPTRVVIAGGPELGGGDAAARARRFAREHGAFRRAVVLEPRGSDALVGALLLDPQDPAACAQVVFFNNVGVLGMCVHGSLGVARTLLHMGRLGAGEHRLETPVGEVLLRVAEDGAIAVENVPCYRFATGVPVETSRGVLRGDIAWGGNWFFLVSGHGLELTCENIPALSALCVELKAGLDARGVTGDGGALIDHVELFGPPSRADADAKNFVLCPGGAYDRSPCGTGTSAKMACLFAEGRLAEGAAWRQESIIGSRFVGRLRLAGEAIIPTIEGSAFVTAEGRLLRDPDDPFRDGIGS